MALILNGTTIPTTGKVNIGSDVTKVVCNGVTVWQKVVFTTKDFAYTGGIETVTVPPGLYKLEVWGAQGGGFTGYDNIGGKGGYSCRYYYFSTETTLYICVGGKGNVQTRSQTPVQGGYNGGGDGFTYYYAYTLEYGTGGGCTHIATRTGLLSSLESYKPSVLVVAGGGGGGGVSRGNGHDQTVPIKAYSLGGAGGGLSGGDGDPDHHVSADVVGQYGLFIGRGGTQTSGGSTGICGYAGDDYDNIAGHTVQYVHGSFGKGGYCNYSCFTGGTGGGGYYGGGGSSNYNGASAGGGGSGYIGVASIIHNDVTYTNICTADQWSGNGKAKITYIAA